jgi:hypothetical protein
VIFRPHRRKKNQRVMNRRQSTSILGKPHPENHKGEGNRPRRMAPLCPYFSGMRCSVVFPTSASFTSFRARGIARRKTRVNARLARAPE